MTVNTPKQLYDYTKNILRIIDNALKQHNEKTLIDNIYIEYSIKLNNNIETFSVNSVNIELNNAPDELKYSTITQMKDAIFEMHTLKNLNDGQLSNIYLIHTDTGDYHYPSYDEITVALHEAIPERDIENYKIIINTDTEIINNDLAAGNMDGYSQFDSNYFIHSSIRVNEQLSLDINKDKAVLQKANEIIKKLTENLNGELIGSELYDLNDNYNLSSLKYELSKYKDIVTISKDNFMAEKSDLVFAFKNNKLELYLYNNSYELYPQQTNYYNEINDIKEDLHIDIIIYNYDLLHYLRNNSKHNIGKNIREKAANSHVFAIDIENEIDFTNLIKNEFKNILNFDNMELYGENHLRFKLNDGKIDNYAINEDNILMLNKEDNVVAIFNKKDIRLEKYPSIEFVILALKDKLNELIF